MIVRKSYTVWSWNSERKDYRMGHTFRSKNAADNYIRTLHSYLYIGTTVKYFIVDGDDAA